MKKIVVLLCAIFCTVSLFAQIVPLEEQLVTASTNGDLGTVQTLVNTKGIDINASYNGKTALVNASSQGHLYIVKELLKHPYIDVNKRGNLRNTNLQVTPLIAASIAGYTDIAEELLKHRANVNTKDSVGYTPLMWASKKGYFNIAVELLGQPNIMISPSISIAFDNARLLAYNNNHRDIVIEILKVKPRLQYILDEDFERFGYNQKDSNGNTLLMLAARDGDIEIVRSLLDLNSQQSKRHYLFHGAVINVNLKDNDRNSALMLAAKYGHLEVVKELLTQNDIRLNYTNTFGKNAYQLAATQEIKDAIAKRQNMLKKTSDAKRQNMLKKTSEALGKQISEGLKHFQLDK